MHCEYQTKGTCSNRISFDLDDNIVRNIVFTGGCNGNLKALSRAVEGKTVEEIDELFSGITCGSKTTSCSDQLATAVRQNYNK